MASKYFVWKDKDCGGNNPEWLEMKGKEFFAFLNSPAGKGRYFILLDNDICKEADAIFIEATPEQYGEWYQEHCHHVYIQKGEHPFEHLSMDALCSDDEKCSFQNFMADIDSEFEEAVINDSLLKLIPLALETLSDLGREAIALKYFRYPTLSDDEIAKIIGVERRTFCKRKMAALATLKNFFKV